MRAQGARPIRPERPRRHLLQLAAPGSMRVTQSARECDGEGLATIRDGYCDPEQARVAACLQAGGSAKL